MMSPGKNAVTMISVVGAILLTGLLLKYAGDGMFGSMVESVAKNVTEGYGQ